MFGLRSLRNRLAVVFGLIVLGADPKEPEYLFTVRGVGYRFRDDEE
jgi:hypothetical protein